MATVRTTAPRGAEPSGGGGNGNKRKRKRVGKSKETPPASPSASSAVDAQLQTLENWHRALTVDMRELRREGARTRMELEKLDDTAEAAVERAEQCAQRAQTAQESAQAKDAALKDAQAAGARHAAELEKLGKKLLQLDKKLERQRQSSINEEFLMTQLTQLQEQYENELTKVREDHDAALEAKQKQLDAVDKAVAKLQQQQDKKLKKLWESVDRALQSLREENNTLAQKLSHAATKQEVQTLQQQLQTLERENQDEQARTRTDLNSFEDKLVDVDTRVTDAERKISEVGARAAAAPPTRPPPRPLPMPMPPPPPPRDMVRMVDLDGIHDALRRMSGDFKAVAADMASFNKRIDAQGVQQEQRLEARLQELNTHVFDALGRDARMHATEISRLKDAVFDAQSAHREFGQRIRRLEDDLQQVMATRAPPRSPPRDRGGGPGWRYGQNQPPVLPMPPPPPPPPPSTFRDRRERSSRYEPAPDIRDNSAPPPPQDRIRWAPRRRSRSRSRSPPHRSTWNGSASGLPRTDSGPVTPNQSGRRFQRGDQRYNAETTNSGGAASTRNDVSALTTLNTGSAQIARGDNRNNDIEPNQEQASMPFRRNRQPRRTPEVIVIEEDDDDDDAEEIEGDDDDDEEDRGDERGEGEAAAPNRAPPDVVLDEEEASQPADATAAPPPDSANTDHVESTDVLEKEADLQTGFLLYFCLGGAPDLDVQWTNCFSRLNADECVEMPRALRFQRRYSFLQNFPVYLTQCILQAVILNGQSVPEGSEPETSQPTGALTSPIIRAKFNEVVKGIHHAWAEALNEYLSKQACSLDLEKLELSINPAALSGDADDDDIIYDWSRRQESAMWVLAQKLYYGSLLPEMKCNADASPAVYLFTLMFDVLTVDSAAPQFGTFQLNVFGGKLMAHLWDHTLRKLPYAFFADWSWLDDQSTKEKLPALAFCHLLASILLWNSAIDRHSLTNRNIYAVAVKHILPKLRVDGKTVYEGPGLAEPSPILLSECKTSRIELQDLDTMFASMLGLDGFFEVTEGIQTNLIAVTGVAHPAST
ncbi:hypothetical protein PR003_g2233 [Phytophthora rubi]|uniref:Uncharacterized protein n=1 Tax=Phytophthora rubi TaxID=129364 RepID=A0A6A4G7T5_9STRA|nr:hypothetical protein PR002_g2148 [Phytophthora rubi]KAE9050799.1 hypothetical protein PR001_g2065 [Phytophthora rubi]KAE9356633.1 hypothetical protein PR003_g2233 [Phytophthora rubi]